ncbi:hypothetical protein [Microcoleus sp. bin38.metabat.b11b12b14.051]|uniref:hypothetical protein n=1 Tax=Microcoleus sp. bin38.metabat.b11b12b14.051 TaxID=2742709 RepID=UPI0025E78953|nr:hypothetical protein [Microcoleus sp. bin38.metabat.b11b12b14.051]
MVAGESKGRSPIANESLQSQLTLNPERAEERDRVPSDLYSDTELDRDSKEQANNIPEFVAVAPIETPETVAGLPNRGDDRQEIPIANLLPETLPLVRKPAPPAPVTSPEQLLSLAIAPGEPEELTKINVSFYPARSKSNLVEPLWEILDIEASSRSYDLTYRQPIAPTLKTEIAIGIDARRRETDISLLGMDFPLYSEADAQAQLPYLRLLAPQALVVGRSDVSDVQLPIVDFDNLWHNRPRVALQANSLLLQGLSLGRVYGESWNARFVWGIPAIGIKSGDSWQQRGL